MNIILEQFDILQTSAFTNFVNGLNPYPQDNLFFSKNVPADDVMDVIIKAEMMDEIPQIGKASALNHPGFPINTISVSDKQYNMFHVRHEMPIDAPTLKLMKEAGTESKKLGAEKLIKKAQIQLNRVLDRTVEYAIVSSYSGAITLGNYSVDYGMPVSHLPALTGTAKWDAHDTSTPFLNIREWAALTVKPKSEYGSGKRTTQIILSTEAMNHLIASDSIDKSYGTAVKDQIDKNNQITHQVGHDFYVYDAYYQPYGGGTDTRYLPENEIIIIPPFAQHVKVWYGLTMDIEAKSSETGKFAKAYISQKDNTIILVIDMTFIVDIDLYSCIRATVF